MSKGVIWNRCGGAPAAPAGGGAGGVAGRGADPKMTGWGRSASDRANVAGSLADGLTSPNRMFASASAPLMPGYQISMAAPTLSIHGIAAGPPVSSTTIVRGFAAATALTSSFCVPDKLSDGRSRPSVVGSLTNTMATSDALASAAAAFTSTPSWYSTFAFGALARTAFSGELGNQTAGPPNRLG